MVYTLTFSPCLDYYLAIDDLKLGEVNRSHSERFTVGGKGLTVSLMLCHLNCPSLALGFIAGFTGKYIEKLLEEENIKHDFVRIKGNTRINIEIDFNGETAINANGPDVSKPEVKRLLKKLDIIKEGDYLSIGGTIPLSLPRDMYEIIMKKLENRGVKIIVDSTGSMLLDTLPYHPFMIKPNQSELSEVIGHPLTTVDEIIGGAKQLQDKGAINVIVSRGKDGAIMVDENHQVYNFKAAPGKVIGTVGAGDSLVGGFIAGYQKTGDYRHALLLGMASGSATAFSSHIAHIDKVKEVYELMTGEKYKN